MRQVCRGSVESRDDKQGETIMDKAVSVDVVKKTRAHSFWWIHALETARSGKSDL